MQLLLYKSSLAWPRRSGHDVHAFEIMRKLAGLGAEIHLITASAPKEMALQGLMLQSFTNLSECVPQRSDTYEPSRGLVSRYARYYGIPDSHIATTAYLASHLKADAIIATGLDALPLLSAVHDTIRIWYAADEWFWHHISLLSLRDRSTWRELRVALVKGLYERSHRRFIDRVWVASNLDQRAMRLICGAQNIDIITNGVDTEYFAPNESAQEIRCSAIFWGRLDFEPNIQAMEWFCKNVWPSLFSRHSDARLTIIGAHPSEKVLKLDEQHGIQILVDVDDLRPLAAAHQVVVFPFVSGGGIKNKLLEAAAMGKAIVSSPAGVGGLRGCHPFHPRSTAFEWCKAIEDLWTQPFQRKELGRAARNWVCVEHTWDRAAKAALDTIKASQAQQRHSS